MSPGLERTLRVMTMKVRSEAAAIVVCIALRQLIEAEKAGFNPNQPRVPAGNPNGGRWTNDNDRMRTATTELGILKAQLPRPDDTWWCVYDFGSQLWMIPSDAKTIGCVRMLPQTIFSYGTRLNDN